MKKAYFETAVGICLAVTLVLSGFFMAEVIKHPFGGRGDAATWAGAFGTFLAFVGTILVATTETRRRNKEAKDVALLHAARMSGEIESIFYQLSHLSAQLEAYQHDEDPSRFQLILNTDRFQAALNRKRMSTENLAALVPLPNQISHRLARGIGLLETEIREMQSFATDLRWSAFSADHRAEYVTWWRVALREPYALIRRAMLECRLAAALESIKPLPGDVFTPGDEPAYGLDNEPYGGKPDDPSYNRP